ncbi:MAG: rhodanese-like domain-containing protein [Aridibacter sp.]
MRFILSVLMISVLTFVLACQSASSSTKTKNEISGLKNSAEKAETKTDDQAKHEQEDDAPRISLADAKKDFDAGDAVFIDTRSAIAYKTEHIKGAISVPAGEFEKYYKSVPKDKKIIAYCS